jgi:phospholipid-binding lipoprotein MlaA
MNFLLHLAVRASAGLCLTAAAFLTGCASGPNAVAQDPLEPLNRSIYSFNDSLDRAVIRPVARTYQDITPSPVRTGISNFFGNIADVWSTVNNVLQLKPYEAVETGARVVVNTVVGVLGLFDVASHFQLERHPEDFGQTLGYWGLPSGPYLVLPVLGPSTLRDTASLPVDTQGNLVRRIEEVPTRNTLTVTNLVDKRARLLKATDQIDSMAIDKYTFVRDVYLQKRLSEVWDGNPPETNTPDTSTPDANPASEGKSKE